jgi:hypothetical protein
MNYSRIERYISSTKEEITMRDKNGVPILIHIVVLENSSFIKEFMARAKSVTWENPIGATWFLAFDGEELVGCCCAVIRHGNGRCKSDFVPASERGRGLYGLLSQARIRYLRDRFCHTADCFSTEFSRPQFLKDKFVIERETTPGIVYMRKTL